MNKERMLANTGESVSRLIGVVYQDFVHHFLAAPPHSTYAGICF
ncbi:MAG: hypothetical protein ACI9CF_001359 [Candidatus Omnitrophota bacterium]|jgi:hypothetical protein